MTNHELINEFLPALEAMSKLDLKGKIRTGYAVSKNILKLAPDVKLYFEERNKIAKEWALVDEAGKYVLNGANLTFETPEKEAGFRAAQGELDAITIETELKSLDIEQMEGISGINAEMLHRLRFIIKEPVEMAVIK